METKARIRFDGRVAVVMGADGALGRALALALGARGASLVVAGARERALGEVVGEIAFGGGKARHVVADAAASDAAAAPCAKATAVFGKVDVVLVCATGDADDAEVDASVDAALSRIAAATSETEADSATPPRVTIALLAVEG